MDKLTRYRQIVEQVIREYASHKPSNGQIRYQDLARIPAGPPQVQIRQLSGRLPSQGQGRGGNRRGRPERT